MEKIPAGSDVHTIAIVYLRPEARIRSERLAAILRTAGKLAACARTASISDLAGLIADIRPDIVFSSADHLAAEDGGPMEVNVHSWLEERGVPFVGSPGPVIDLALSKPGLKRRWTAEGIPTPLFVELPAEPEARAGFAFDVLPFPCIVKPSFGGNSRGIDASSVARNPRELESALLRIGPEERSILVEAYLGFRPDFREITCACVGNGEERICSPAEILLPPARKSRVVTTEDKTGGAARAQPLGDPDLAREAAALGARIFSSLGVRDYARCDLAFAEGRLWAIEANGQPMVPDPWFGACMAAAGLAEAEYLSAVFDAAAARAAAAESKEGGS